MPFLAFSLSTAFDVLGSAIGVVFVGVRVKSWLIAMNVPLSMVTSPLFFPALKPRANESDTGGLYLARIAVRLRLNPLGNKVSVERTGLNHFSVPWASPSAIEANPIEPRTLPRLAEQVIFCKRGECQTEGGMD